MDKSSIVNTFTSFVDQLHTTECSQKEKMSCFQHIAECIQSPAMISNINYATHCSNATRVLLLFCEDLDSVVRMSAEENLNKILRLLEKTRVGRILLDLYGEIRRNGNQRSLRICLNLFSYYAPHIREKHVNWYALRMMPCIQSIARRKETQLCETLTEFVKSFGQHLQIGLTDSDTWKLFEVFISYIGAECPVKRRCMSQNCISLIEYSRNRDMMAKNGLKRIIEILLESHQHPATVLGTLGFLRLLLPIIIRSDQSKTTTNDWRQIVEIYDYCLFLLSMSNITNHSIINASLEVINSILQSLDGTITTIATTRTATTNNGGSSKSKIFSTTQTRILEEMLCNHQLQHNEYLKRRKSLKNQIFQLKNIEMTCKESNAAKTSGYTDVSSTDVGASTAARLPSPQKSKQSHLEFDGSEVGKIMLLSSTTTNPIETTLKSKRKKGGASSEKSFTEKISQPPSPSHVSGSSSLFTNKNGKSTSELNKYETSTKSTIKYAFKLEMQKSLPKSGLPFEKEQELEATAFGSESVSLSTTSYSCKRRKEKNSSENKATNDDEVEDDDDDDDDDDGEYGNDIDGEKKENNKNNFGIRVEVTHAEEDSISSSYFPLHSKQKIIRTSYTDREKAKMCIVGSTAAAAAANTAVTDLQLKIHHENDGDDDNYDDNAHSDGFTTLLKINEPNQASTQKEALGVSSKVGDSAQCSFHSSADVGNLIDATETESISYLGDDKSQLLSDIDNESFNSIDFESEITIGGDKDDSSVNKSNSVTDEKSSDTIGSFFNILLSHSSAESVSKLFRAAPNNVETKINEQQISLTSQEEKSISFESLSVKEKFPAYENSAISDSLSLESINSRVLGVFEGNEMTSNTNDDTFSVTPSVTASTAILQDNTSTFAKNTDCFNTDDDEDGVDCIAMSSGNKASLQMDEDGREFFKMQINIGSVYDQPIIYYTIRLVAAKFLLTGQPGGIRPDYDVRVSIKNLSLIAVANCVRLMPDILILPLEIGENEICRIGQQGSPLPSKQEIEYKFPSSNSSKSGSCVNLHSESSSNSEKDFDHLDSGVDVVDFSKTIANAQRNTISIIDSAVLQEDTLLLDIKDDHFGESTTSKCFLSQPLSKSANPILISEHIEKSAPKSDLTKKHNGRSRIVKPNNKFATFFPEQSEKQPLERSLKPKNNNSGKCENTLTKYENTGTPTFTDNRNKQTIEDVMIFFNHSDPILRGNVQILIGNFIKSLFAVYHNRDYILMWDTCPNQGDSSQESEGEYHGQKVNVNKLLAILIKGLHDDIHTVVIHALNAFDKTFPAVMSKYLTIPQAISKEEISKLNHRQTQFYAKPMDNASHNVNNKSFCCCRRVQHTTSYLSNDMVDDDDDDDSDNLSSRFIDDDAFIDSLLIYFQRKNETGCCCQNDNKYDVIERKDCHREQRSKKGCNRRFYDFFISPKLLLSKLRLCFHNKYWLVQNKYAEVVSNLNYVTIREYYGIDVASSYEEIFLEELLQLVGDDDCRVREHVAECLCHFISKQKQEQNRKERSNECSHVSMETHQTNFNLLWDFFDYRIFSEMAVPLRDLFRVNSMIPPPLEMGELNPLLSMQRQFDRFASTSSPQTWSYSEEKLLAKVLYRMANKLMQLNDKNYQFGIIYLLKVFLIHFNYVDYHDIWMEFNFTEICLKLTYTNLTTAIDLNCQNDLIDVAAKLITGNILVTDVASNLPFIDNLLVHILKILNIYYHLFTQQQPLLFSKIQKSDIFINAKELAIVQSVGYFGNDHVYIQLYNILKCANDSYKITINQESGLKLMSLLKTCINTLSLCIEMKPHSDVSNATKLIEEIIQYLFKLINYAPAECISCLRQMLKSSFGRNYGSMHKDCYKSFIVPFFNGKTGQQDDDTDKSLSTETGLSNRRIASNNGILGYQTKITSSPKRNLQKLAWEVFAKLLINGMNFADGMSGKANDGAKHIKVYEPLVIHSLTLFMKTNARVQAPILELLSQLLDLNVTYSVMDAKNVIFEQIMNNLELIEAGVARNACFIIPQTIKFLVQLTCKSDRKLITIPKIISITNNLLANNAIRDCSVLALKSLAYEIFFMRDIIAQHSFEGSNNTNELDTQKEVVVGMVEKFIDSVDCQKMFAILLLHERSMNTIAACGKEYLSLEKLPQTFHISLAIGARDGLIYSMVTKALCDGRIKVNGWDSFFVLDVLFKNCGKNVLSDSKEFSSMLSLFIKKDVGNFSDLSYATVILENVILKTEEIYLVNHIKLYLKNDYDKVSSNSAITPSSVPASPISIQNLPNNRRPPSKQRHASGMTSAEVESSTLLAEAKYSLCEPSTSLVAALASTATTITPLASKNDILTNVTLTTDDGGTTTITSINEINYFAKVLCEKLDECLASLTTITSMSAATSSRTMKNPSDPKYWILVARFIRTLYDVSKKDALQSVFRMALEESNIWNKYNLVGLNNELVQTAILKLFSAMKQLDRITMLQQIQADGIKLNVQRTLLQDICLTDANSSQWNFQEVQQVFSKNFLNILIRENFTFVCNLCEVDDQFFSLFQGAVIENCDILELSSIRNIVGVVLRFYNHRRENGKSSNINGRTDLFHLLAKLFNLVDANRALQNLIERTARRIIADASHDCRQTICDSLMQMEEEGCRKLGSILFNGLEYYPMSDRLPLEHGINCDEKWLVSQIIQFSSHSDPEKLSEILLDINSETKLHKLFTSTEFNVIAILGYAIETSLKSMLNSFRNNCIQFNPHIHYMTVNPLGKVAIETLMIRIEAAILAHTKDHNQQSEGVEQDVFYIAKAVISLIENIRQIECTALIYIESKFIDKFVSEHLLKPDNVGKLLNFIEICCDITLRLLLRKPPHHNQQQKASFFDVYIFLKCLDAVMKQKLIWSELNKLCEDERERNIKNDCLLKMLDVVFLAVSKSIPNTIFYKRNKMQLQQIVEKIEEYRKTPTELRVDSDHPFRLDADEIVKNSESNFHVEVSNKSTEIYSDAATFSAQHLTTTTTTTTEEKEASTMMIYFTQVAFLAKFIETKKHIDSSSSRFGLSTIVSNNKARSCGSVSGGAASGVASSAISYDFEDSFEGIEIEETHVPMNILVSIGISILRMNRFYAFAVTPAEVFQQQLTFSAGEYKIQIKNSHGKLPSIPLEHLSDGEVLRKFVKRLSIFGFTTRQQFEEYFTTFLLLINKVYDENIVDQQEQFQIKSTCLEAILELLITYKTFPIVGNKLSHFHHTTRWSRIDCNSISLKKLHKVQLIVSDSNIFYLPNLERNLSSSTEFASFNANTNANYDFVDNVIGTKYFLPNQFDLNFIWQRMEEYVNSYTLKATSTDHNSGMDNAQPPPPTAVKLLPQDSIKSIEGGGAFDDISSKNFVYFSEMSGIDFKSSSQLIFDVLMQIVEYNHILVLPNLVKFCEICDSRDQIKFIKNKAFELQSTIPVDDTISHQHIIYLLCKTQAMLIPSLSELVHLCSLIQNYLKSSHVFIRNATLAGLLCLLECCSKTNTTIGKLSEELSVLRALAIGYINWHCNMLESTVSCSDVHAKLVWTLNFSLIEWTTKFVPQCQLMSNTIILASNFLKRTTNEHLYLCILHGLERIIVVNIATSDIRCKIEKLALELVKLENEKFSIPALKLLLSCIYMGSSKQLENTELSNGIVQDDPEIIAQQTEKVDILLHCIRSSTRSAAWIHGKVLCQIIRDLVPPNEILTKVIKEFVAINQPHCNVIAMIVFQVFRSAIDSSYLPMLQDWLICSLPTFLALPEQKGVWGLTVIFLSASINLHLIKLFPIVLADGEHRKLGHREIRLFLTSAQDFHSKLSNADQKTRFQNAFKKFQQNQIFSTMLQIL